MSVSSVSSYNPTTALDVLANAASTATQLQSKIELDLIGNQIQKQLSAKITALQAAPDGALTGALQTQISALQKQLSAASSIGSKFGANAGVLADLQNQLGFMQTAAAAGDTAGFDLARAAADIDVGDLTLITPTAPYQPDQVSTLKAAGLSIGDSATYDLSTPQGQAAAAAAVQTAQALIGDIFQATTSNQIIAGSIATSLSTQIGGLTSHLQSLQQTNHLETTMQILQLTQQAQNQLHLIELALGNAQLLATSLMHARNPPQPFTSPFDALQSGNATSAGIAQQTAPAILSLLT